MNIKIWTDKIHDMDNGSLAFTVETDGHMLSYSQWWENCGETGETFECSCGFGSTETRGCGCWQQHHDIPQQHGEIDTFHADMILSALEQAKQNDIGYPAEWRGLAMLAVANVGKKPRSMSLLKRAQRIAQ